MNPKIVALKKNTRTLSISNSRSTVLLMGVKILVYSAVVAGIVFIILLDARQPDGLKFSEQSYTEYAQELAVFLTTILFYLCVHLFPKQAIVGYLLGGFFGMAYIREYDAFLDDKVADGAWQVLAYSLATVTTYLVYRKRELFWQELERFIISRPFGFILTGMLTVFIFSRLYGLPYIWKATMNDDYMYLITRAGEESIELLGYTLILLGTLDYFFYLLASRNMEMQTIKVKNDTEEPAYY